MDQFDFPSPSRLKTCLRVLVKNSTHQACLQFFSASIAEHQGQQYLVGDASFSNRGEAIDRIVKVCLSLVCVESFAFGTDSSMRPVVDEYCSTLVIHGKGVSKEGRRLLAAMPHVQLPSLQPTATAKRLENSSVGIIASNVPGNPIVGSGFIVDSDGIVVTNRHVIEEVVRDKHEQIYKDVMVLYWHKSARGQTAPIRMPILDYGILQPNARDGPDRSDLAFLHIGLSGLPSLPPPTSAFDYSIGTEIASSGYPRGSEYLIENASVIVQTSPFFMRGTISAIRYHQVVCDLPVLGGSSGSPVVSAQRGELIGVVSHTLTAHVKGKNDTVPLTTAGPLSLAVSSRVVYQALVEYKKKLSVPTKQFESMRATFDKVVDEAYPRL